MWSNLTGVVGAAIQKVREIESQLDSAVGVEKTATPDDTPLPAPHAAPTSDLSATSISPSASIERHGGDGKDDVAAEPSAIVASEPLKPQSGPRKKKASRSDLTNGNDNSNVRAQEDAPMTVDQSLSEIARLQQMLRSKESELLSCKEELQRQLESQAHRLQEKEMETKNFQSTNQALDSNLQQALATQSQLKLQVQSEQAQIQLLKSQLHEATQVLNLQAENHASAHANAGGSDAAEELQRLQRTVAQQADAHRAALEQSQQRIAELEVQSSQRIAEVEATAQSRIVTLERALQDAQAQLSAREGALETRSAQLSAACDETANLHQQVKQLQQQIGDVQGQLQQAQQGQSSSSSALAEQLRAKDAQLAAFEAEGKQLAKKQSEMEKSVRQSKQTVREKEGEIAKLKESREQLVKALEQTQDALKKQEAETEKAQKALQAMQAVTAASSDRLTRLETDLQASHDEQATTRRALEAAWGDLAEQKRLLSETKGEADDLRRQLGEGASRVMSTESLRREVEQREAVLRATSQQLQEQLSRVMSEAAQREERIREELTELRRRWQEAVSSRESLASELAHASAPLLRQIAALQEQLRVKSEQWAAVETSLVERAMRSEAAAEQFEHRRSMLEEQVQTLRLQLTQGQQRLHDTQNQLAEAQEATSRLQRLEHRWQEERIDWQSRMAQESAAVASMTTSLRELELRHRLAQTEAAETLRETERRLEAQCDELQRENAALRESLARMQSLGGQSRSPRPHSQTAFNDAEIHGDLVNSNSFVAAERAQQRQRQRDEELSSMQNSVGQLSAARDALLEEVSFLSARNAQLEDATVQVPVLQQSHVRLQQQVDVLLVLLGEKEEENEALAEDLRDTRHLYREQLDALLARVLVLEQESTPLGGDQLSAEGRGGPQHPSTSPQASLKVEPKTPLRSDAAQRMVSVASSPAFARDFDALNPNCNRASHGNKSDTNLAGLAAVKQ